MLDTNVLVAVLRSDQGASRRLLLSALDGEIQALVSVPLLIEYEAVFSRPHQLEASGLTIAETNALLDALAAVADQVHLWFLWRPRLTDPADEMVLETAVNGRADRLVTFNLQHFQTATQAFGIQTLTPPQAWKEVQDRYEKK
ncbi:MAG: putative toxin-antitoxin system toxin component, PIN family [Bryobacteraceae bacterium]